jgi:hypothetical protein
MLSGMKLLEVLVQQLWSLAAPGTIQEGKNRKSIAPDVPGQPLPKTAISWNTWPQKALLNVSTEQKSSCYPTHISSQKTTQR